MNRRSPSLNAAQRTADLDWLSSDASIDVLVIGGGVTGTGVALDAASRGLSVALVERRDLANGTSRQSSKLIHGGLRYLRQLEIGLAWESARERHIMMSTTAPHLVHPLAFLAPLNASLTPSSGALTEAGIRFGDVLRRGSGSRQSDLPRLRRISAQEALALAPALRRDKLRGALLFWDGQLVDDARLVIGIARTAAAHGARIVTYCAAESVESGRVQLRDERSGEAFTVRARAIVNAAGVWAGGLAPEVRLQPSKGSHLIVRAEALHDPRAAIITPVPGGAARWVGCTPVGDGRVIVGVTDDEYSGPIVDDPQVTEEEERFLLSILAQGLERPVTSDDIIGRYAGFRPLLAGADGPTADLSRRHTLVESPGANMTTVVGGKLTTYRKMAEDAVDRVCSKLGVSVSCRTATLPLVGAAPRDLIARLRAPQRLVERYGREARDLVDLANNDPSLLEPIAEGVSALGVELLFGILHEGALTVDDLLDRRVRLGPVPAQRVRALHDAAAMVQASAA